MDDYRGCTIYFFGGLSLKKFRQSQRKEDPLRESGMVVNISSGKPYDVYVGRGRCPMTGKMSIWGNPFVVGKDGTRDEVISKYLEWIVRQPDMMSKLGDLVDKKLGCWCLPKKCHGTILAELAEEIRIKAEEDRT